MKKILLILFAIMFFTTGFGQQPPEQTIMLTLPQTVELARKQSPEALYARHNFRSSYWNYTYYKANYLPSLTFSSSPYFNHSINPVTLPDGTVQYVPQNLLRVDGALSVTQNVALTGGSFYIQTNLQRLDILDDKSFAYKSSPVIIGFRQSLLGYNSLKWDRKIEPVRYEAAKKTYVETLELVAANATARFFNLARAQTNLSIANQNYANADTLYTFAKGRYDIGTISENDMLQLEVKKLQEETARLNAQLDVDDCMEDLRSFLGIKTSTPIRAVTDNHVPLRYVDLDEVKRLALLNSPDMLNIQRARHESDGNVAYAKGNTGLKADLYMQLGLAQTGKDLNAAYKKPLNQQYVEIGISFPILDWGRSKGQVQVAKSRRDLVYAQTEQEQSNFEQNITKLVKQFNIQPRHLEVAEKTDITALRRSEVARRLYLLGKSTILDLNASITEKDAAKRNYINALYSYWSLYYTLRSLTLYDFEKNIPLTEDYEMLLNGN
jgi:outer membrane protein TolC